jgi:hypothetical protein
MLMLDAGTLPWQYGRLACHKGTGILHRRRCGHMVVLYCPCPERHRLWGELWWVEEEHRWVFFDDLQTSETYAEQVDYCPACGRPLERKDLRMSVEASR